MILSLNYSNLSGTVQQTNKLCEELGQYCDELNRKVQKKMYSVEGGMSSHLNNADYYVNNKIKKLREKQENAYNISKRVSELLSTAQRVDEDVARLIENRQKEFFKENSDLKTPLYQSVIQGLIGNTPLGSFLLALNLFKHFSPVEELQKNIKNSFKSAFNSAQNYVGNISDKVSSTVKNITDKEDKKSTGNGLTVAGILAGANSVKSWVSDLITNIKDFWQKHWGTTTTASSTKADNSPALTLYEQYRERVDKLKNISCEPQHGINCTYCALTGLFRRKQSVDNLSVTVSYDEVRAYVNYSFKAKNKANGTIPYSTDYVNKGNMSAAEIQNYIIKMLDEHDEGIEFYAKYTPKGRSSQHAIVITDYEIINGKIQFYACDPVTENGKRVPIEQTWLYKGSIDNATGSCSLTKMFESMIWILFIP